MGNKTFTRIKGGVSVFIAAVENFVLTAILFWGSIALWGFSQTLNCLDVMKETKEKLRDFGEKAQSVWEKVQSVWEKVQSIWEKIELKCPWLARFLVYFVLFVGVILVCNFIFDYFKLYNHISSSSLKYMLSALAQSEAAIVAIVITLTLIAVELTAHEYSTRVVDIFKKNPDMWFLLGIYGISIFYSLMVLKFVPEHDPLKETEFVTLNFSLAYWPDFITQEHVSFAFWLGIFSFVALVPYMLNIIKLLKSTTIIEKLSKEISRKKILKCIDKIDKKGTIDDPFQPVVDLVFRGITNHDHSITKEGLKGITNRTVEILLIKKEKEQEISNHFCNHLQRVGVFATSKADKESTRSVIKNLEVFGKRTAERKYPDASKQAAESLCEIGKEAAKQGEELEESVRVAAESLCEIGKEAAKQGEELEESARVAAESLCEIGKEAVDKELEKVSVEAVELLHAVGEETVDKILGSATRSVAVCLGSIGKKVAETERLPNLIEKAALYLCRIGTMAAKKQKEKLKAPAKHAVSSFLDIAEVVFAKQYDNKLKVELTKYYNELSKYEILINAINDYKPEKYRESYEEFLKHCNEGGGGTI